MSLGVNCFHVSHNLISVHLFGISYHSSISDWSNCLLDHCLELVLTPNGVNVLGCVEDFHFYV
jgi:hypothetical protein